MDSGRFACAVRTSHRDSGTSPMTLDPVATRRDAAFNVPAPAGNTALVPSTATLAAADIDAPSTSSLSNSSATSVICSGCKNDAS
eukprot:2713678-Prymnesium_polylepis.1